MHWFLATYYPVNSTDVRLLLLQTKVEKKAKSVFLHLTENSDHSLLCIINIWTFGLLYLPPNEKQRSALEGLACFRQWKTQGRKNALRIIQTICVHRGHESFCMDKLPIPKLRSCPMCYLLMWHKMATCQMQSSMEGSSPFTKWAKQNY